MREEMRWTVDPIAIESSLKKAEKIIKRANAKGLQGGFSVSFTEENGYPEIVVTGEPFSYGGWNFVAVIEKIENGEVIIKSAFGYEGEAVEESLLVKNFCQHCNTKRQRNTQVIVENAEGERKILGSTCVKDFLGWAYSPVFLSSPKEELDGIFSGFGFMKPIAEVLWVALGAVELYGYRSVSSEGLSTKDRVERYFGLQKGEEDTALQALLASKSYEQEIAEIMAFVPANQQITDYARNLRSAFKGEYAFKSTLGLIVSAVSAYGRVKQAEIVEATKTVYSSEPFAKDGEKVEFTGVVLSKRFIENYFGYSAQSSQLIVFEVAGQPLPFKVKTFYSGSTILEEGQVVTVKATVKKFEEYKGEFATMVTRSKFEVQQVA